MKKLTSCAPLRLVAAVFALALAGCSSYSEIAPWDSSVRINDDETPRASFVTQNFSYQLLCFIPVCTGKPWLEGEGPIVDEFDVKFFADEATIDNNLRSLQHALDVVGSHRIANLRTTTDDDAIWSLFILNRHEVRTQCIILNDNK